MGTGIPRGASFCCPEPYVPLGEPVFVRWCKCLEEK
jgi:hypothetical protein